MKKTTCFTTLLIISLIIPSVGIAETVSILPFETTSPGGGKTFTIDVKIESAIGLFGFEFDLFYNPEFLKFVSATEGDFLKSVGPTFVASPIVYREKPLDGGVGTIKMGISRLGGTGVNGDGVLAKVEFEVLKEINKPIPLEFKTVSLYDAQAKEKAPEKTIGGKIIPSKGLEPPLPPETISPEKGTIKILTPTLEWSAFETAFSYIFQIAKDKEFAEIIIEQKEIEKTQYKIPENKLKDLSTYYWRVKSVNSAGESDWSEISVFRVVTEFPRWDVNADGVVDISDLVIVGQHFGEDYLSIKAVALLNKIGKFSEKTANVQIDVQNKIGVQDLRMLKVDITIEPVGNLYGCQFDLSFDPKVLKVIGTQSGDVLSQDGAHTYWNAPEIDNQKGKILGVTYVRKATKTGINASGTLATAIFEVKDINPSDETRLSLSNVKIVDADVHLFNINTPIALLNWEKLLVPEKSKLLQNYPNPFNPETWIPYHLEKNANVSIHIYDVKGKLVRTLHLGSRGAGIYMAKDRAGYWDGKDNLGEKVASGMYYYTLQTGDFRATRKMVILK